MFDKFESYARNFQNNMKAFIRRMPFKNKIR